MKKYEVTMHLHSLCYEIEAESEDDAVEMALSMAENSDSLLDNCVTYVEEKE